MAISYTKVGWDTSKYVNPTNMNQMDNGIKAACDGVDALDTEMGTTSISSIGDGTVTGAISTINSDLNWTLVNTVTGSTSVNIPSGCRELMCECIFSDQAVILFHFLNTGVSRYFVNGSPALGDMPAYMVEVYVEQSNVVYILRARLNSDSALSNMTMRVYAR